jgi:hypothetical protein
MLNQLEDYYKKAKTISMNCKLQDSLYRSDVDLYRSHVEWLSQASSDIRKLVFDSSVFQVGHGARQSDSASPQDPNVSNRQDVWAELPAAITMDLRDVLQLLDWCDFRTKLLQAEMDGRSLASVIENSPEPLARGGHDVPVALTGFACAGSWMIGVDHSTHSPALAKRVIEEITSLRTTADRAEKSAGIPARKDFFDFHGGDPVPVLRELAPGADHITWQHLLTYTVSRTYTRNRAICSRVKASEVLEVLSQNVLNCMTHAFHEIEKYTKKEDHQKSIERLQKHARKAATEIFAFAHSQMSAQTADFDKNRKAVERQSGPCSLCVYCDDCPYVNEKPSGARS